MKFVNDYGAGFLQLDTEIYNTLLDAKKGNHELLKFFKIQYLFAIFLKFYHFHP